MQILVKENQILEVAHSIEWGTFDEPIEKWALLDEQGNVFLYVIDDGYTVIKDVELPIDYVHGKYYFEDGELVLDEEWEPYVSPEERIAQLEEIVAIHEENDSELLYQICLLQLGIEDGEM